uniref:Sema domain-containing protein n=1 Tax=Strigamia maritima TaxID=126957 RepID=T1JKQ6_STRMM
MRKREKRRRCLLTPCAVTVLFLLVTTVHQVSASVVNFTRSETETSKFNRLTIDRNSGRVFVGAVNWIYQLLPNLQLEVAERTGPQEDSPDCPVTRECPSIVTKPTDSINKVLVIDYIQGRLITCGSLFQGLCFIRKLSNISITDPLVNEPVAANNNTASTVAFIAPGPPNPPTTHVLYVGVSYTGNGPYRTDVPAVCSRSLEPGKMLSIAAASVTTATRILVNTLARERYPINYIYGFHSRGFSYFLTTQKRSIENQYPFVSKLIRICHKDPDYYSYTEIPIECRLDNVDYNLVQAAFLGNPGSELANELGVSAQDDVLYAVFSQSKNDSDVYDRASAKSGLCVYSLRAIHRQFTKNIQHCFSGNGDRGLDFINPSMKCVHTKLQAIAPFTCVQQAIFGYCFRAVRAKWNFILNLASRDWSQTCSQ